MRLADLSLDEKQSLLDHFTNNARTNLGISWDDFCVLWSTSTQDQKREIYQHMKGGLPRWLQGMAAARGP